MIPFNPDDPFPLLESRRSYREEQEHSRHVDAFLGLEIVRVEEALVRRGVPAPTGEEWVQERWIGLAPDALLTPYTELRELLSILAPEPGSRIVDLGAAYGRMGFVMARHFPGLSFVGYELVEERVAEGRRCLERFGAEGRLVVADLGDPLFKPEEADIYFLYDFGSRLAVAKCLEDLKEVAASRAITVVGRGRGCRDRIEHKTPWLSQVVPPRHYPRYSVYRSG
ncbi:MAG TPA: class I SAM-dependent methyltransferase [Bdellovibrionota bacterium]|nr:class I SAM-dependent methyltransferase [Bdellovibrionota bacterium]